MVIDKLLQNFDLAGLGGRLSNKLENLRIKESRPTVRTKVSLLLYLGKMAKLSVDRFILSANLACRMSAFILNVIGKTLSQKLRHSGGHLLLETYIRAPNMALNSTCVLDQWRDLNNEPCEQQQHCQQHRPAGAERRRRRHQLGNPQQHQLSEEASVEPGGAQESCQDLYNQLSAVLIQHQVFFHN